MNKARMIFIERLNHSGYIVPAILTGFLWTKGQFHFFGIACPFKELTGVPCPSCFLTRATSNALQGNIGLSIDQHIFGPIVAIGLVVWSFQSIKTRRIIPENLNFTWAKLTLISIIIYWLIRIILQYGYNLNVFPEY